jgi:membrane protease YdiL (CAAX protease family)
LDGRISRSVYLARTNTSISVKSIGAALVPYVTLGIGLFLLHNAWVALLSYHLGMLIILFFEKKPFSLKLMCPNMNPKILIVNAVLGGAAGLLIYLLWPLLGLSDNINLFIQSISLNTAIFPYFMAYFVLINPWLEEYYWRGYLGSNSKGIILHDLLFAGYHILILAGRLGIIWLVIAFIILFLTAWFWRQSGRWSQGLAASITSHFAADTSIILLIYFMVINH